MPVNSEFARFHNMCTFIDMYNTLLSCSDELVTRGMKVKELRNFCIRIDPIYPVTSFDARKLNLNYAKAETLWYLRGDRFDTSICSIAGAWNDLIQPDGGINSNYGQVIFKGPKLFDWVVEELARDMHSRRAVMVIGDASMLNKENTDHRCTMYISYQIRDNVLDQTVHMRSNDAIFGITNDVFFFGLLHQMVYVSLLDTYPDLELGDYIHLANSLHVYERHFGMLKSLAEQGTDGFTNIDIPVFESKEEVNALRLHQGEEPCAFTSGIVPWLLGLS